MIMEWTSQIKNIYQEYTFLIIGVIFLIAGIDEIVNNAFCHTKLLLRKVFFPIYRMLHIIVSNVNVVFAMVALFFLLERMSSKEVLSLLFLDYRLYICFIIHRLCCHSVANRRKKFNKGWNDLYEQYGDNFGNYMKECKSA